MTNQLVKEILSAAYEGLNGLSIGWHMANVKDDAKRTELQAPINAGQDALIALIKQIDPDGSITDTLARTGDSERRQILTEYAALKILSRANAAHHLTNGRQT